jgi:hypothetical protein
MIFFSEHLFPCAYKSLFGIDCPMCGFQRALVLLIQGDFLGSIKMYSPLIPILFLCCFAIIQNVKPNIIEKKYFLRYSIFVLSIITLNYLIKLAT